MSTHAARNHLDSGPTTRAISLGRTTVTRRAAESVLEHPSEGRRPWGCCPSLKRCIPRDACSSKPNPNPSRVPPTRACGTQPLSLRVSFDALLGRPRYTSTWIHPFIHVRVGGRGSEQVKAKEKEIRILMVYVARPQHSCTSSSAISTVCKGSYHKGSPELAASQPRPLQGVGRGSGPHTAWRSGRE